MTDEQGIAIVKGMVGTNNEMLFGNPDKGTKPLFADDDPRRAVIVAENAVLATLLPKYLTAEEIEASLTPEVVQAIKDCPKEGQATGIAMKHLKTLDVKVEGDTVKAVVQKLRT